MGTLITMRTKTTMQAQAQVELQAQVPLGAKRALWWLGLPRQNKVPIHKKGQSPLQSNLRVAKVLV